MPVHSLIPDLSLQFLEIMTMSREREAEEDAAGGRPRSAAAGAHGAWGGAPLGAPAAGAPAPGGPAPLPLDLMMLGYKRKKLVDGVMAGDGTREQLIARGEAAELRKCGAAMLQGGSGGGSDFRSLSGLLVK